jgi:hypothetical protein
MSNQSSISSTKTPELSCMAQSLILFGPNNEFLLCWVLIPNSLTYNPVKTDFSDIVHKNTKVFLCYSSSKTSSVLNTDHFITNKKKNS